MCVEPIDDDECTGFDGILIIYQFLRDQNAVYFVKEHGHYLSKCFALSETRSGQLNASGMSCMKGRF